MLFKRIMALLANKEKPNVDKRIPSMEERMFTYFYYDVSEPIQGEDIQICWNWGWDPLPDHIYIHDIYIRIKGCTGRIYDDNFLTVIFDEFSEKMKEEFPTLKGISLSETRFRQNHDLWLSKGFDSKGVFVPGSGTVYSVTW